MSSEKYTLSISLNVLDSLGINLYSNASAVLSEVVANSWDADAEEVRINLYPKEHEIVITDTGCGMTEDDLNKKYLNVGFRKRECEYIMTPKYNRHVFGRKGIGKLALFSIANIVEVRSVKEVNGIMQKNGLIMNASDIRKHIEKQSGPNPDRSLSSQYHPTEVDSSKISITKGTEIILRDLKKEIFALETNLRQRLARRFSAIGQSQNFAVFVGNKQITVEDRDYFPKLQFIWIIDEDKEGIVQSCKNAKEHGQINGLIDGPEGYRVSGWVGTFDEHKNVDEGSNTVVILAWGKLIHEDILKDVKEGGVFSKYLIGELRADFLDFDNKPDISTTGRQMVKEDEERYLKLKNFFVDSVLREVGAKWEPWRRKYATEKALENKKIGDWYSKLSSDKQQFAQKLFQKIESFPLADLEAKKELYKHGIIAFETLALKDRLSMLDEIRTDDQFDTLQTLMGQIDSLEATLYLDIVSGRLKVLKKFIDIVPTKKEKIIQQYLFDHLWLLDSSWERPSENVVMEQSFKKEFKNVELTPEEKRARIDIRYKTAAGKHIIIELKKYGVQINIHVLAAQVQKYRTALRKCLRTVYSGQPEPPFEIICILGSDPTPTEDKEANKNQLLALNARYITYDRLIKDTLEQYDSYIQKNNEAERIRKIVKDL